jgi:ABC-type microcin C transport system permease subunit YejB
MKYTKYLIDGKFINTDSFNSRNGLVNVLLLVLAKLPAAFMGVVFLSGLIPMAMFVDGLRSTKYRFIIFQRRGYRF